MYRSETNRTKNAFLAINSWLYSLVSLLLNLSIGIIYPANRELVSSLHRNYLLRPPRSFLNEYLTLLVFIPRIFIYDRLLTKNRKGGAAVRMISKHLGRTLPIKPSIKEIDLNEYLLGAPTVVTLVESNYAPGNVTLEELYVICAIAGHAKPKTLVEIGTFDGRTTLNLANNCPEATVYTLDLPREERGDYFQDSVLRFSQQSYASSAKRIITLYGDSKTFDFSFLAKQVDFVFVDGAHTRDYAENDSTLAFDVLGKPGTTVVWHDYKTWDGVTLALNNLRKLGRDVELYNIRGTALVVGQIPQRVASTSESNAVGEPQMIANK